MALGLVAALGEQASGVQLQEQWSSAFLDAEELDKEDADRKKAVYLITVAALQCLGLQHGNAGLVCPSRLSREDIARAIKDAFAHPSYANVGNQARGALATLECFVVFLERHSASADGGQGKVHFHIAVKASTSFRFMPYKRALRERHGLATHWSTVHTGYWSTVRYGCMPTPKKPRAELDPTPFAWSRDGTHPPLFEVAQEPTTAVALSRRREFKVKQAAEEGNPEPRPTEMDLYPIIVQQGFRNTPDDYVADKKLVQFLKNFGTPALVQFAFKNRHKLAGLIDDVWSWETVGDALALVAQSRLERLSAAAQEPCVCGGRWRSLAEHAMQANGINPEFLCTDIYRLLKDGRREDRPVVVLAGHQGGEGKSFFFAPLKNVFGVENVQSTPQPGSFPLLGLEKKKVVLLDEWCFDAAVLPLATQLLWYEGKAFPVTRPQNKDYTGHLLYQGSAPIFVTCKEKDLQPIINGAQHAMQTGTASENTMLLRRLRVYRLCQKLPVGPNEHVLECPACFSSMVLHYNRAIA